MLGRLLARSTSHEASSRWPPFPNSSGAPHHSQLRSSRSPLAPRPESSRSPHSGSSSKASVKRQIPVMTMTWDLKALVLCTAVLYLKFLATTMIQGRKGFAAGTRAPEDKALPMAKGLPTETSFSFHSSPVPMAEDSASPDHLAGEEEARWKRIIQNDLESIPFALAVFVVANFSGSDRDVNATLTVVYTVTRVLHTIAYASKRPVARMVTWLCGVATVVAMAVLAVASVV